MGEAEWIELTNAADADIDSDSDGWSNWQEYFLETDPRDITSGVKAPRIDRQPSSQTVGSGKTAHFDVLTSASIPLSFQWWFKSQPLLNANEPSLNIQDVQLDHVGDYFVVVANGAGSVRSSMAHLTAIEPPDILSQPQSVAVNPGTNVTLSVLASSLNSAVRYQWKFNGTALPDATRSTLSLTDVQSVSEGDYSVVVFDDLGERTSLTARLTVKVKPVIVVQPTPASQTVVAGDTAQLTVSASGSLPMTFRWRRGTSSTTYTNMTIFTNTCVLLFPNVVTNLAGKWSVNITNLAGTSNPFYSSNAELVVLSRPVISLQPVVQSTQNEIELRWTSMVGKHYRVQFKNHLNEANWSDLPADIVAVSPSSTVGDTLPLQTQQRYYRVVQLP